MKGNTMTLSPGNIVRFSRPTVAAEPENTTETADKELFLQLVVPIKKHLYNFIRKSLNFSHDADDIFQETLLKSFRYFHSFKQGSNFKAWIFTIAHNLVKDYFRKPGTLVSLEDADIVVSEEDYSLPDDVREIYHMAGNLKPRHREVFFLYYYNEFKVPEIVEITGLTKFNIKYILHQARKSVKDMMEVSQ
jgi:RNA polymerase sigma-70 factor (ECF subfamily)